MKPHPFPALPAHGAQGPGARRARVSPATASLPLLLALIGPWGCASNINDLLAELEYGDTESVKETIIEVGGFLSRKEAAGYELDAGDREAIAYLEDLAQKSPEPILRACALASLARIRGHDATAVFVASLRDDSAPWIVRLEAASALTVRPSPAASDALASRLGTERRLEVRLEIVKALRAARDRTALRALLDAFLDEGGRFRHLKLALYNAVVELSGQDYKLEDGRSWRRYGSEQFPAEPEVREEDERTGEETAPEADRGEEPAGAPAEGPGDPGDPERRG